MNYIANFWLKSGAAVLAQIDIDATVEKQEAEDGLETIRKFINNGIRDKSSGTVHVGDTYVSIQEIAAYAISLIN